MSKALILASASPRRAQILTQVGLKFQIKTKSTDENIAASSPQELVRQLSYKKAQAVASDLTTGIVLGADTVVVVDGQIFGKPHDRQEAFQMLSLLANRAHEVITGFSLIDVAGEMADYTQAVSTKVYFRPLTEEEINNYLDTNEYTDKAGGYAIQGIGAQFVEKIEGCYYNVVGLPLTEVVCALAQRGVSIYD